MKIIFHCLLAILALGCNCPTSPSSASLEKVKIGQFGQSKFLFYLPLYTAMESGFFKEQGLDVDLYFVGNDDQIFSAVASGSIDFGIGDPIFSAIANEKGFKSKIVALLISKLANFGYTKNANIPVIEKPEQLANLRIGTYPSPSTTYVLLDQINQQLAPDKKFALVEGSQNAQVALLSSGQVDIASDLEPTASIFESQGYKIVMDMTKITPEAAITGVTVLQKTIDQKKQLVQKVVNALTKASQKLLIDQDIGFNTAVKIFPDIEKPILKKAVDRLLSTKCYPKSIEVPQAAWETSIQIRKARGDINGTPIFNESVDNSFAYNAQSK